MQIPPIVIHSYTTELMKTDLRILGVKKIESEVSSRIVSNLIEVSNRIVSNRSSNSSRVPDSSFGCDQCPPALRTLLSDSRSVPRTAG